MTIFTIVFGRLANMPSEGAAPYPLMVMAGMLPWFLFSTTLSQAANSLVANTNLVSKVYFPRLIVPIASAVVALIDFAITLLLTLLMMLYFGFFPDWKIIFLPIFTILAVVAALGPALILTSLNVKYRDFRFVLPFVVQFGLYASPVGFSSTVIPEHWRIVYSLNPAVGVIDGFRWCLLSGASQFNPISFIISLTVSLCLLVAGVKVFRATEKTFADML